MAQDGSLTNKSIDNAMLKRDCDKPRTSPSRSPNYPNCPGSNEGSACCPRQSMGEALFDKVAAQRAAFGRAGKGAFIKLRALLRVRT